MEFRPTDEDLLHVKLPVEHQDVGALPGIEAPDVARETDTFGESQAGNPDGSGDPALVFFHLFRTIVHADHVIGSHLTALQTR